MIGDILFVHGKGLISDTIEYFDKGSFSHVCIEMPNDCIIESQYFVNTRIIPNPYKDATVVSLNLTKEQQNKLVYASFKYLKDIYDIKQIEGLFLEDALHVNVNWNNPHKLICSELVVDILTDVGFFSLDEHEKLKNATPNSLYDFLKQKIAN